jgi:hypothetical protein
VDEITYLKIACPSCEGHVEFPQQMRGQVVSCPHCSLGLHLELASTASPALPPGNLYQRLRALNNLPPKPITINLPEAFLQRPDPQG